MKKLLLLLLIFSCPLLAAPTPKNIPNLPFGLYSRPAPLRPAPEPQAARAPATMVYDVVAGKFHALSGPVDTVMGTGSGTSNCPGAGGTPNAFLVDSGTQGTCTDSSVLAGGTAGTFLYNGFTNALPGTSGTLLNAVPTKYTQWSGCNGKGLGTSGSGSTAVAAGTYVENTCTNDTGATVTLTGLNCFTDNSGTSTLNASGHTLGALLTGAITCSTARATGTQSANVLLTAGDWIVFTFVADGTSKETDWNVTGTY